MIEVGAWLHQACVYQVQVLSAGVLVDSATVQSMGDAIDWLVDCLGYCGEECWPAQVLRSRLEALCDTPVASSTWVARRGHHTVLLSGA